MRKGNKDWCKEFMKKIFAVILLNFSIVTLVSADDDISISGFSILKNTDKAMTLRFRGEKEFIISKARFKSESDARSFCRMHKSALDTDFSVLMMAMSGAADLDRFIEKSITFKFNSNSSGIWSWSGKSNNGITMMFDGRGTSTHEVAVLKLNATVGFEVELPAVCSKSLFKQDFIK